MTTESIIDAILSGDMNNAGDQFEQELGSRISDALDAKRVEVGGHMGFDQEFDQPIEEPEEASTEVEASTEDLEQ